VCGSGQQMRCAYDSMQWRQRVCGSGREQPAAQLQWDTVMAVASWRHNCDGQRWRRLHKGWRDGGKIAMNNDYNDGQLRVKEGVGGCSG
jgi:hypothetical protein